MGLQILLAQTPKSLNKCHLDHGLSNGVYKIILKTQKQKCVHYYTVPIWFKNWFVLQHFYLTVIKCYKCI